jgi:hypothetical protein
VPIACAGTANAGHTPASIAKITSVRRAVRITFLPLSVAWPIYSPWPLVSVPAID